MGESRTPLVEFGGYFAKSDHLFPSGSFKDRGSSVLSSCLLEIGVESAVVDSSGNAGASMAAYFARARIPLHVFVSTETSPAKLQAIRSHGARLVQVAGDRQAVADEAVHFAETSGSYYASHQWSAFFLAGMRTLAWEIVEQMGASPQAVVMPLGAGTMLLGAYQGFCELREAGLVERLPRIYGVQSEGCPPLALAFAAGLASIDDVSFTSKDTAAEGIRVGRAPRARQILAAVRDCAGSILTVGEPAIRRGWATLARDGIYVEPTSAVVIAAMEQLQMGAPNFSQSNTVVVLSGSGLKLSDSQFVEEAMGRERDARAKMENC